MSSRRSTRTASSVSYQVPIIDIDYAVSEVHRLAGIGARSVHLPNFPSEFGLPDYHEPALRPAVGRPAETGIAISHHLGRRHWLYNVFQRDPTPSRDLHVAARAGAGRGDRLVDPDRHPRAVPLLKIVFVEPSLYWIPGFLAGLDRKAAGPYDFPGMKMSPSEYFHRNMACTFMDDEVGLRQRHMSAWRTSCGRRISPTRRPPGRTRRAWWPGSSPASPRTRPSSFLRQRRPPLRPLTRQRLAGLVGGGAMPERPSDISDHDGVFYLKRGSGTHCRQDRSI